MSEAESETLGSVRFVRKYRHFTPGRGDNEYVGDGDGDGEDFQTQHSTG